MTLDAQGTALIEFLMQRRSVKAGLLEAPGPDRETMQTIMTIAARVPDHKKLTPWRFIVFEGEQRSKMGDVFADACLAEEDQSASETRLATERARFLRAPVVVALISSIVEKPAVPELEQILSTGAVGLNMCLAANAFGYGSQWLTEWIAYSPRVRDALKLDKNERVAGFIYIGTATERLPDRPRPALEDVVTYWK